MKQLFALGIEKLAMGGFGIAYFNSKAIFVPYTAPGDVVDVNITHERKSHAFGRVLRYVSRGEAFCQPECSAFGSEVPCGGCDWLLLDYASQLKHKQALVAELFTPFVGSALISPTLPSPQSKHYRNKVFMPVGKDAVSGKITYGIYSRWTHSIVPHEACANHPPVFDALAKRIMQFCTKAKVLPYNEAQHRGNLRHIGFRSSADGSEILVVLVTLSGKLPFSGLLVKQLTAEFPQVKGIVQNINREHGNIILGAEDKILYGVNYIYDKLGGLNFRINYRSFWQINTGTMELIMDAIRAQIGPKARVLDAFSGIGAIGLCLANEVEHVSLLEEIPEAIEDAKANAEMNGINNVSFYTGKCEELLPEVLVAQKPDIVIADPPRSGIDANSLQVILLSGIKKLVYVSCAPMTLARDIKILLAEGAYKLDSLQSFDMFPNTWHIECLAVLSKQYTNPTKKL